MNLLRLKVDQNKCLMDNFKGCIAGLQIGDSLGMSVSGWLHQDIKEQFGILDTMVRGVLPKGEYTDDTEQALAIAEALCSSRGFDGNQISKVMFENHDKKRNYDIPTIKAIEALKSGFSWIESGNSTFYSKRSYGNSAATRIAPIALLYFNQPEKLIESTVLSSRITHVHPLAIDGAKWQANAISYGAYLAKEEKKLDPFAFCDFMEIKTDSRDYLYKLRLIRRFLKNTPSINEVISELGCANEAIHSVPTALYSFLAHEGDFKSAVTYSVNLGGDADAIGAMTGALCGVYGGFKAIPEKWLFSLKDKAKDSIYFSTKLWKLWMYHESCRRERSSRRLSRM